MPPKPERSKELYDQLLGDVGRKPGAPEMRRLRDDKTSFGLALGIGGAAALAFCNWLGVGIPGDSGMNYFQYMMRGHRTPIQTPSSPQAPSQPQPPSQPQTPVATPTLDSLRTADPSLMMVSNISNQPGYNQGKPAFWRSIDLFNVTVSCKNSGQTTFRQRETRQIVSIRGLQSSSWIEDPRSRPAWWEHYQRFPLHPNGEKRINEAMTRQVELQPRSTRIAKYHPDEEQLFKHDVGEIICGDEGMELADVISSSGTVLVGQQAAEAQATAEGYKNAAENRGTIILLVLLGIGVVAAIGAVKNSGGKGGSGGLAWKMTKGAFKLPFRAAEAAPGATKWTVSTTRNVVQRGQAIGIEDQTPIHKKSDVEIGTEIDNDGTGRTAHVINGRVITEHPTRPHSSDYVD